jgi:hypothetical protein
VLWFVKPSHSMYLDKQNNFSDPNFVSLASIND